MEVRKRKSRPALLSRPTFPILSAYLGFIRELRVFLPAGPNEQGWVTWYALLPTPEGSELVAGG
jgi:hypothetical protein